MDVLGLEVVMDMSWIVTLADPGNPKVQISLMTEDATAPVVPVASIEVGRRRCGVRAGRGTRAMRSCTR